MDVSPIDSQSQGSLIATFNQSNGKTIPCIVKSNSDGTYTCSFTPTLEGNHQLHMTYEGLPIPGSPYSISVLPGFDANRVRAFGPGLENGPHLVPHKKTHFTVDLVGAGQGGLGFSVEGPAEAPITCQDNRDGTCTVYYTPTEFGSYIISVRFNDVNIPGRNFLFFFCFFYKYVDNW